VERDKYKNMFDNNRNLSLIIKVNLIDLRSDSGTQEGNKKSTTCSRRNGGHHKYIASMYW